MLVSRKCQYALRATLELSKRYNQGPVKIADIASAQAIPKRFLVIILNQMKQAGIVESFRGKSGGYMLALHPKKITFSKVLFLMGGAVNPVECIMPNSKIKCPFINNCAMLPVWNKVRDAIANIYNQTNFHDLAEKDARLSKERPFNYHI